MIWRAAFAGATLLLTAMTQAQQMTGYSGPVFPPDNALNMPVDSLPVHPNSDNLVAGIGAGTALHPDFGTSYDDNGTMVPMGIPYNVVGAGQPFVPIVYTRYGDESDPGPWPIPSNPYIEGVFDWRTYTTGDRHLLVVDSSSHTLYESGNVYGDSSGTSWEGGCGAVFHLDSDTLRPETWTSADAAGLPIFPLLIRYDEVERALASGGEVHHAIRFTADITRKAYLWPARHYASSSTDTNRPAMGQRFRLKAGFDISGFSPRMQVILRTMKKYGLIVADNGGNWFFQGTHDDRWDDNELNTLKTLHGSDFEAVDISPWTSRPGFDPNSGAVPSSPSAPTSVHADPRAPSSIVLSQNFPNPFNPTTAISYSVPPSAGRDLDRSSSGGSVGQLPGGSYVTLQVIDMLGRVVKTLVEGVRAPGSYTVTFNGSGLASGVYFYQLRAGGLVETKKLVVLK